MISTAWAIGAGVFGVIIGAISCAVFISKKLNNSHPNRQKLNAANDRVQLLMTLRRELANYMVRRDPDRFLALYEKSNAIVDDVSQSDKSELKTQLASLCEKYPFYTDFDLFLSREHVLYEDAISWNSFEEIEGHYLDLVKFQALQSVLIEDWKLVGSATSQNDLEHLKKYVQEIKDTIFRQRIVNAIDVFYKSRNDDVKFENDVFQIRPVYHIAENRYGIYFKDTDEYGLYCFFVHDDPDKVSCSYYRSDEKYENEGCLDANIEFDGPLKVNGALLC